MFSSSICAPLTALIAYVVAVSAAPAISSSPSLTVKTSTSNDNVGGPENLKVTATIVNAGGEALKLLNDPRGVLNPFPEDTFLITDPSGSHPSFIGATANYSPTDAAVLDDPGSFTVLAPGDSIDVTHDLSAVYNFIQSGAGEYSIEPSNHFIYIDAHGTAKDLYATVEGIAKVKLSGDLRVAVSQHVYDKRTLFYGCSRDQRTVLFGVIREAQLMADDAYLYLRRISRGTPRYRNWFGVYNDARKAEIQSVFMKLSAYDQFSRGLYICGCRGKKKRHHRLRRYYGRVHICDRFWKDDKLEQATHLVHEFTHFVENGDTKDHDYIPKDCERRARRDPKMAAKNASNYAYFADNLEGLR